MTHSVLTTVAHPHYGGKRYFIYASGPYQLRLLTKEEAAAIAAVLNEYPATFTTVEVVSRTEREIIRINIVHANEDKPGNRLDFDFELVEEACPGILEKLSAAVPVHCTGISYDYTKRIIDMR